jgi:hypothetical protein
MCSESPWRSWIKCQLRHRVFGCNGNSPQHYRGIQRQGQCFEAARTPTHRELDDKGRPLGPSFFKLNLSNRVGHSALNNPATHSELTCYFAHRHALQHLACLLPIKHPLRSAQSFPLLPRPTNPHVHALFDQIPLQFRNRTQHCEYHLPHRSRSIDAFRQRNRCPGD